MLCFPLSIRPLTDDELIPDAPHVDDAHMLILGQLMAQLGDEHVQAALVEERIVAPQIQQHIVHVHYLVGVFAQAAQYLAFAVGEFRLGSLVQQTLGAGREDVVAYLEHRLCRGDGGVAPGASQQGLDADNEFLHAERFLQIVVAAQLEAFHHVVDGRAGGEEKHGRVGVGTSDAAHHLEAIHAGHHHVGHQHVGLLAGKEVQTLHAVPGQADAEALSLQGVLDNHGKGLFVFY